MIQGLPSASTFQGLQAVFQLADLGEELWQRNSGVRAHNLPGAFTQRSRKLWTSGRGYKAPEELPAHAILSRKGPTAGYAGSDASGDTSGAVRSSAQEPTEETSQNRHGSVGTSPFRAVQGEEDVNLAHTNHCGKATRRINDWYRGSERRLSIRRSALRAHTKSQFFSCSAFSKNSKALSFAPSPA